MMLFLIYVKRQSFSSGECSKFIITYYINDDVNKHQTNENDTFRILITDILLFQWIHNREICQGNVFFDGGKNSFPNG